MTSHPNTCLLKAVNLFCERDDRVLFENLNFEIHAGTMTQIEGPNGAGKTTLLRMLAGLSQIYEGNLLFSGVPLERARVEFNANLLYMGHKPGIKSLLSPLENLRALCGLNGRISDQEIEEALAKVGLYGFEEVPCHSLSAGQQRRVALARLFLSSAPLWILDEAFTAIDKKGVRELEALFAKRVREGGTVVLTTHHELQVEVPLLKIMLGKA